MMNKKNKKHSYKSKSKKHSEKKHKKFYSSSYNTNTNKSKFDDNVKVVSTNVNKDSDTNKNKNINTNKPKVVSTNINKGSDKNKNLNRNISNPKVVSTNVTKSRDKKSQNTKKQFFNNYKNKEKSNYKNSRGNNFQQKKFKVLRPIIPYELIKIDRMVCAKCQRIISDMASSIENSLKNEHYHFDCVIKELKKNMAVQPNQRVVYTGNGSFSIIEDKNENGKKKFVIKQHIQYVNKLD